MPSTNIDFRSFSDRKPANIILIPYSVCLFRRTAIAGVGSAAQQSITSGEIDTIDIVMASATAGMGGRIGQAIKIGFFRSTLVMSYERKWYTLWLYKHEVVNEVWDETWQRVAESALSGTVGGSLSAAPGAISGSGDDCECNQ
ncbi:MAG: hypothetical protein GY727_12285 [Gammaproteobacteria bacterium]|nr:hypothetical protein [Gammaproteobacteria bacterium]